MASPLHRDTHQGSSGGAGTLSAELPAGGGAPGRNGASGQNRDSACREGAALWNHPGGQRQHCGKPGRHGADAAGDGGRGTGRPFHSVPVPAHGIQLFKDVQSGSGPGAGGAAAVPEWRCGIVPGGHFGTDGGYGG